MGCILATLLPQATSPAPEIKTRRAVGTGMDATGETGGISVLASPPAHSHHRSPDRSRSRDRDRRGRNRSRSATKLYCSWLEESSSAVG
eukprot:765307-Hanusia_phi.AAC.8